MNGIMVSDIFCKKPVTNLELDMGDKTNLFGKKLLRILLIQVDSSFLKKRNYVHLIIIFGVMIERIDMFSKQQFKDV